MGWCEVLVGKDGGWRCAYPPYDFCKQRYKGWAMIDGVSDYDFMVSLEEAYRVASGIVDRELYKIYYSMVHRADILVLGINPAGRPNEPDRIIDFNKHKSYQEIIRAYCEGDRHDLIDYQWPENRGLLKLLEPLLGSKDHIRKKIVKTNLAFRRSGNARKAKFIRDARNEAKPYLSKIISRVSPKLILLMGATITDFVDQCCVNYEEVNSREIYSSLFPDSRIHQTIFWSGRATFSDGHQSILVSTAHASQFSWIYEKQAVVERIRGLLEV